MVINYNKLSGKGMHNIRSAGQMLPAEAQNLDCFFHKKSFVCVQTHKVWPLDNPKKIIWPAIELGLCIPALGIYGNLFVMVVSLL